MNYRELLLKYIRHVQECEGVTYIEFGDTNGFWHENFTAIEWAEMEKLEKEALPEGS